MSFASVEYNAVKSNGIVIPECNILESQDNQNIGLFIVPDIESNETIGKYLRAADSNGKVKWESSNELPAGINTSVQYNNNGVLDGDPDFTWTYYSKILNVSGTTNTDEMILKGTGQVTITCASTSAYQLIFPETQGGYGTTLTNDGSGNLSWSPPYDIEGYVIGPGSSTNNSVSTYNNTKGTLIKNNSDFIYSSSTLSFLGLNAGITMKGGLSGTTTLTYSYDDSSHVCSLPNIDGNLTVSSGYSTINSMVAYDGDNILKETGLSYTSPTLTTQNISLKGSGTGTTILQVSSGNNNTCTVPAVTGSVVIGPDSVTANSIATFTSNTYIQNTNLTYLSPTLFLAGTGANISMKGSSTGTTILSTSNASSTSYVCSMPELSGTLAVVPSTMFYMSYIYPGYPGAAYNFTSTAGSTYTNSGMGNYLKFTPTQYTTLRVMGNLMFTNTSVDSTVVYTVLYGTGTPPIAGDAGVGTPCSATIICLSSGSAGLYKSSSFFYILSSLTLNTEYWVDIGIYARPTAGYTYNINSMSVTIEEIFS